MKTWTILATELLPPRLHEFVRLIGLPATMLMVDRFGGLRIYIPLEPTPEHMFAELIGFDNLVALCSEFNGDRVLLPRALRALNAVRNAKIRAEYGPKSLRDLASEYRLTERHVSRIVADLQFKKDQLQTSLDW